MSKAKALGFSPERLARIDALLQDTYVGPGRLPNAQFLLARRGEVAHQTVLGQQDPERGVPLAEDTVFRIYSMSKPVTSVVLMQLVEEGRIALDDLVAKHLPEFTELGVFSAGVYPHYLTRPAARPMQVVDLMRHTSGLTYGLQHRTNVDSGYRKLKLEDTHAGPDLAGLIKHLGQLPLEFSPGEAWNYSIATDVLGAIIERLEGRALDQVFQDRIFGPLGMVDTGFQVREDQRPRFGACYVAAGGGKLELQDDPQTSPYLGAPAMLSGGGGLVGTAADYMRFANMLLNGGELDGARILAPKTLRLMATNHLPGGADLATLSRSMFSESTNAGIGFGLGFAVVFDAPQTLIPCSNGEFYWGGAASTAFWVDPVEQVTAVFMTQVIPSSTYPIRRQLRTLVYGALMESNA